MAFIYSIKKNNPCDAALSACWPHFWSFVVLALAVLWPDLVWADVNTGGGGTLAASTFGDILCNAKATGAGYPFVLNAVSYVMGAFLAVRSILLFKKHGESPGQAPLTPAIAHFIGAGFLLSLPTIAAIIQKTFMGNVGSGGSLACGVIQGGAANGLDKMMINFVKNVHGPMFSLLSIIAIIVGLTFIVKGLLAGIKTGTDPRASNPRDIVVRLAIGAVLISMGSVLPSVLASLFGTGDVSSMSSFQGIAWSKVVGSGVDTTAADNAVKAILAFVQIVGGIAFLRGWLMVKAAVEGGGQVTIPQAVTHIVGGAMAINIDTMLSVFDKTFGTGMIK